MNVLNKIVVHLFLKLFFTTSKLHILFGRIRSEKLWLQKLQNLYKIFCVSFIIAWDFDFFRYEEWCKYCKYINIDHIKY
jgi:hypothetical protein